MRKSLADHQEVAHFWANEVQEEGRSGNMFFENKTIFSYGRHFAIAKHYDNGLVLLTNRGYSVSTANHVHKTRYAIPGDKTIIYCHDPEYPSSMDNLTKGIQDIESNLKKAVKARQNKPYYLRDAENAYGSLVNLKKIFKIKGWKIPKYDFENSDNILEVIAKKEKAKAAKQKRIDKKDMVEFLEDISAWKLGGTSQYIRHRRFLNKTDYCRINGDIVETSRSSNAPLAEVKILLQRIKADKPVQGLKLGYYTILKYDKKTLTVGCHKFDQSELDYLVKELEFIF